MVIGDDGTDWDKEAERAKTDIPFTSTQGFDYFRGFLRPDMVLLDLGCNIGKWYPAFRKLHLTYEGLDFCIVAIEEARKRYPEVRFYLKRAEEMSFEQKYDVVFTNTFLQHLSIETKRQVMPRVWRALKPNGYFILRGEKSDLKTATTFTRKGWIKFTVNFGFKFIKATPLGDPTNGYVFQKSVRNNG